ncbi:MAG: LamG domain-containing protein [Nocardioides sp.]
MSVIQIRRTFVRFTSGVAALAAVAAAGVVGTAPAEAVISGTVLSGTNSSMWQTDSEVFALAVSNGVLYAGGSFTTVRPPGTAVGSAQQVTRTRLAAFNASTGALITTFNLAVNGRVNAMDVSPNGNRLYLGGQFTTVGGTTRNRVAAINITNVAAGQNGTVDATFNPNSNRTVVSLDSTASTVYIGGDFTTIGGGGRSNFASVSATNGSLNAAFNPVLAAPPPSPFATYSPRVNAIEVLPGGSRVLAGGSFNSVDGVPTGGLVSFDPASGDTQSWPAAASQPINTNCGGRVTDIIAAGTVAYVTAEGDPPGCYEGTYAARVSDGVMLWNSPCLGASQGLAVMDGILYKGSHQHDCAFSSGGPFGGYVGGTSRDAFLHRYLVAQDVTDGSFVHWSPNTNATSTGGTTSVGPQVMATDGTQIFVGGDFSRVNGANQQGLARFRNGGNTATPEVAGRNYNGDPWPNTPLKVVSRMPVTVQATDTGTLTVEFPAVHDPDSGTLTYRVYRDTNTLVGTVQAESWHWSRPVLRVDDTGLAAGSTHTYQVTASDGTFTSNRSTSVSGTVRTTVPPSYQSAVSGLNPLQWWRLDDAGGTAADASGNGRTGSFQGGVATGQPGELAGNSAVTLNGSSGYVAGTNTIAAPNAFSQAAWFKTTTNRGGVIVAQSDRATGPGGNTDRIITMDNNGSLVFAAKSGTGGPFGVGTINIRNQGPVWNDGEWHLAVGTYDGAGNAALYVDGWLQGSATGTPFDPLAQANGMPTSYVRAGYADLSAIQLVFGINFYNNRWPLSDHLDGSVDEVSTFDYALTQQQVATMFAAGVAGE